MNELLMHGKIWFSGVLEPPLTSLQEAIMDISFQLHVQLHHVVSLKSATVGILVLGLFLSLAELMY